MLQGSNREEDKEVACKACKADMHFTGMYTLGGVPKIQCKKCKVVFEHGSTRGKQLFPIKFYTDLKKCNKYY